MKFLVLRLRNVQIYVKGQISYKTEFDFGLKSRFFKDFIFKSINPEFDETWCKNQSKFVTYSNFPKKIHTENPQN